MLTHIMTESLPVASGHMTETQVADFCRIVSLSFELIINILSAPTVRR
jgi:hypothetical protein